MTQRSLDDVSMSAAIYDLPPLYDLIVRPGPCETFYRQVARHAGGPVLELACGTGRLTVPLALAGCDIVGLDVSPQMLAAARAKARAHDVDIAFVEGDMRVFDLGQRFGLVIVSCNSLAHLTTNEDLRAGFRCVRRHLAPGGLLAFDVVLPDVHDLARSRLERVRLEADSASSAAVAIEEVAAYDPVRQIRVARWRVRQPGTGARKMAPIRLRQFFPQELPLLLEVAGLELVARYGDFDRSPLRSTSANQICLARPVPSRTDRIG